MAKKQAKLGRPRRTKELARPTTFTVDPDLITRLDKYAAKRERIEKRPFSRSEALCEILRMAFKSLLIVAMMASAAAADEPKRKVIFWVMPSRDPVIQQAMEEKIDYSRRRRQDKIDVARQNRRPRRSYPGRAFINGKFFIPGLKWGWGFATAYPL